MDVTWTSEDYAQHTFRYFVRSYVTKPTTINAITDIPAKMPRPIGRTEIFFPGIWKAASAEEDGEAVVEALSATVTADELLLLDVGFAEVVASPTADTEVCDEVVDGVVVVAVEVGIVTEDNA